MHSRSQHASQVRSYFAKCAGDQVASGFAVTVARWGTTSDRTGVAAQNVAKSQKQTRATQTRPRMGEDRKCCAASLTMQRSAKF